MSSPTDDDLLDLDRPAGERGPRADAPAPPRGPRSPQPEPLPEPERPRLRLPGVGRAASRAVPPAAGPEVDDLRETSLPELPAEALAPVEPPPRSLVDDQVLDLRRQIGRLESELSKERARPKPPALLPRVLGAAGVAGVLGLALGWAIHPETREPVEVTILPPIPEQRAVPAPSRRAVGADGVRDARHLLGSARKQLSARDLNGAESALELCIEAADLPECHRQLGSLRALVQDPRAWASFERYLSLDPDSPQARRIDAASRRR